MMSSLFIRIEVTHNDVYFIEHTIKKSHYLSNFTFDYPFKKNNRKYKSWNQKIKMNS